jgi:hypothetical protein
MDMRLSPEEAKMCAYTFRDDVQSMYVFHYQNLTKYSSFLLLLLTIKILYITALNLSIMLETISQFGLNLSPSYLGVILEDQYIFNFSLSSKSL